MKEFLRKHTPKPIWNSLKRARLFAIDSAALLKGRPPDDLVASIGGNYDQIGKEFISFCKNYVALKPDDNVLEVGCGIGRIAEPFTEFLSPDATYDGFDIVERSIHWCRKHITRRYRNFRFVHADIYNKSYNPTGRVGSTEFPFPYRNETFDFVFLTSVFTHMLPRDVEHYLVEIRRVLKPGGRCLITWFLLNEESTKLIDDGRAFLPFAHSHGECLVVDPAIPEAAIAYKEERVIDLYAQNGIKLSRPIHYGSWCGRRGRTEGIGFQDVCIGYKGGT